MSLASSVVYRLFPVTVTLRLFYS